MNIGIYQTVNAHAPAIHWWLAHDPRFGPQLYEGTDPCPNKLAIGNIVQELRNDEQTQEINEELYNVHQETLREMENKRESDQKQHLELCRDIAQKFNKDFKILRMYNYFGNCYSPEYAPLVDKLIFARATTEQSAMFYITQYAFNTLSIVELTNHCKIWWEDHMLMGGDTIGKWKEVWYRDYHDQCIADLESGKLQYMWQLNFAHWDLEKALRVYNRESFELDYSWNIFEEKHNPDDFHGQNDTLGYIKENNIDHLVVDVEWFKNTDVILDYLGVSNSQVLTDTAKLYSERYKTVVEAYDILYNKYYVKGEQV